ncbi:MAG: alanine dehydrogenase [Chloroflexi bacterium]|nr:alanine dehydrogenase [Chloroflexota bacterium]MBI2759514.1 alanine dehydrogenase [Chloroflexota bacterium]MBI3339483.1 alanine dehydrogenase [Chloroflexota bacterium]
MNIGIPKERRPFEFRVGLSPAGVEILVQNGHKVFVEHEAGVMVGFSDSEYEKAGARLAYSTEEVIGRADLLLKVARPMQEELNWLQPGSILTGFLHLASARQDKINVLLERKVTAIAYEQITAPDGSLPVLRPFSQIGGAMAAQIAARLLQNNWGGKGILMGGVPGVPPAEIVILGAGVVGTYATQMFLGMGAHVTIIDQSLAALQHIWDRFPNIVTMLSTRRNIERSVAYADVVVGAVLSSGQRTPILVTREMVRSMKPRSVIMDVSIDEGGCVETSRPTTHEHPVYIEEGILHYCVPNMPGAVARTATHAFVNAAMPYITEIAALGPDAVLNIPSIEAAVNTHNGENRHLARLTGGREVDDGLD